MSVDAVLERSNHAWPLRVRGTKPSPQSAIRTIRIGLLGLGHRGQAVARLAADTGATAHAGLRFRVEQALVPDTAQPGPGVRPGRVTSNPAVFLRGNYDVVIDALDGIEPARTLVSRLLGRGTAVVTANKALVAAHGANLEATAADRGVSFRFESTALSAVPFLGTLAERPLVASINRLTAIVTEPGDDLDGMDAANKLVLLTSLFGWGRLSRDTLDVRGIAGITADDLAAARSLGGTIKAVVSAERDQAGVRAFVGPAFLPATEPLASIGDALNGIRLDGKHVSNLFFSGPGATPDVTAATLLDDAIQAASTGKRLLPRPAAALRPVFAGAPATPWLVRITVPGVSPGAHALTSVVGWCGLRVECVADFSTSTSRWLFVGPHSRRDLDAALARLENTHRIRGMAFRRIGEGD